MELAGLPVLILMLLLEDNSKKMLSLHATMDTTLTIKELLVSLAETILNHVPLLKLNNVSTDII